MARTYFIESFQGGGAGEIPNPGETRRRVLSSKPTRGSPGCVRVYTVGKVTLEVGV